MAINKPKRPLLSLQSSLATTLCFVIVFTIPALLLLHTPTNSICTNSSTHKSWSGDLRFAEFAWNRLRFDSDIPPPISLKIAVFTRKWPTSSVPGGMERHAHTLHTTLAQRGHEVHVFTSPPNDDVDTRAQSKQNVDIQSRGSQPLAPLIHWHEGEPGKWRYNKAWEQYEEENNNQRPFDVIHSESVALPFHVARRVSNLAVSWHGIALESVQSSIYQDLTRQPNEPISPSFNDSLVVVGSGPWLQRYRDLGPQVIAFGSMDPSELRAFYNSIDIFVNPTLRPQGLDLTLMEAMMSGKPVMASRFPSIKGTIVVNNEYGFMFAPNTQSLLEALELVVAEGSKRLAQRGKACQEYASSMFTARKMALAYERLFMCIKNETFCIYN